MVECRIVLPDGKTGKANVNLNSSIGDIKRWICEDCGLDNAEKYNLAFYTTDENKFMKNIVELGCTIKVERKISLD